MAALFDRGSQVETVQALRAIYRDQHNSQSVIRTCRKPKLNFIMERYAAKRKQSGSRGRFPSVTPNIRNSAMINFESQNSQNGEEATDSVVKDAESTKASQEAILSQLDIQKKITARLQNLKELFDNEETQNRIAHEKYTKNSDAKLSTKFGMVEPSSPAKQVMESPKIQSPKSSD